MPAPRKPAMMPAPRPFRVTRFVVRDRDELTHILQIVDAALSVKRIHDGDAVMRIAYDVLLSFEPTIEPVREVLEDAASWGAAIHRVEVDAIAESIPSLPTSDTGHVDLATWNALAWTAFEVSCRLESRICALADYFVKAGYFVAHHGASGEVLLKKELAAWVLDNESAVSGNRFEATIAGHHFATFWCDDAGTLHARRASPLRSANSAESIYEDLLFDIAWDDVNERLGRGRPRKTTQLSRLAPIVVLPSPIQPPDATTDENTPIGLLPPPQVVAISAGWYHDPRRRFDFRWWDGARWTDVVSVDGVATRDTV